MTERYRTTLIGSTATDQIIWQRRATELLGRLILQHQHLPPISWTVGNAGCTLTGAIPTTLTEADIREAWIAWRDVLRLTATPARTDQISTRLLATGRTDGVRLVLTATIYTTDDAEAVTA